MTTGNQVAPALSTESVRPAPEGSRQCPYCPKQPEAAEMFCASAELGLLTHFVGLWERFPGSRS